MRVVIDTNVLVSSFLSASGSSGRIIDMLLLDRIQGVYDDRMYEEYREVLSRKRFEERITAADRDWLLEYIRHFGLHVGAQPLALEDALTVRIPDPDDMMFLEVAVAGAAEVIITGNNKHFQFVSVNPWNIRIASPSEALAWLC